MSNTTNQFSVGDYIINFENIYQITEQKEAKDFSGKMVSYFCYKPVCNNNQTATYSTPINNLAKSGFRHLLTTEDINSFYEITKQKHQRNIIADFKSVKDILYLNDPNKNMSVVKQLLSDKNNTAKKSTKTDTDIINQIIKHTSTEISFVTKENISTIEEKLNNLIQESISN